MTRPTDGTELLRTDRRGRVMTTAARREQLLAEFSRSGLSGAKFAALAGVKYSTFAAWVQSQRRQSRSPVPKAAPPVEWLETVIGQARTATPAGASALLVRLPSGAVVEVTDAAQAPVAAALLRAWERAACRVSPAGSRCSWRCNRVICARVSTGCTRW